MSYQYKMKSEDEISGRMAELAAALPSGVIEELASMFMDAQALAAINAASANDKDKIASLVYGLLGVRRFLSFLKDIPGR